MADLAGTLGKAIIFRGLKQAQILSILKIATVKQFAQGSVIFKEGDRGGEVYLIVKGKVRITRQYPLGGDETLAIVEEGHAFGEMAVFDEELVRSATARAAAKSELLILKRDPFRQLLQDDRDLAATVLWNVLKQLSNRLRATNDKVMMFLAAPVLS
jgi:CRP/FNR family transcriptional regulator, cyclic AMP receptor protein